jgi:TRAP-type C4-dicarboxylate transport system permease small subunit
MTMAALASSRPVSNSTAGGVIGAMRRGLDGLYLLSGYLAAASMVAILGLTVAQVAGRLIGVNLRGLTDYAGYFMAAAAFLAFAHALNNGAHIRIEIFLSLLGKYRNLGEKSALVVATAIAAWFAYHSCAMVYWTYVLGDMSQGLDATPLWIPQLVMAFGTTLFAISLADHLVQLIFTGKHGIQPSTEIL